MGRSASQNSSWHRSNNRPGPLPSGNPPPIGTPVTETVGIPSPPDYIFKFRERRQRIGEMTGMETPMYPPERAEYIEGKGNFVYYKGIFGSQAPALPSKTVVPPNAIYALNPVKRKLVNDLQFFTSSSFRWFYPLLLIPFIRKSLANRYAELFVNFSSVTLRPFYLHDGYYCTLVKEVRKFAEGFFVGVGLTEPNAIALAEIFGVMFEYDNAYRYRIQDVLDSATGKNLKKNFPKEIKRLFALMLSRDTNPQAMGYKFEGTIKILSIVWYLPFFGFIRKAAKKAIENMNLDNCKLEEDDLYHTLLFGDYNTQGKTFEERLKIYENYHGSDRSTWPQKVILTIK